MSRLHSSRTAEYRTGRLAGLLMYSVRCCEIVSALFVGCSVRVQVYRNEAQKMHNVTQDTPLTRALCIPNPTATRC